MSTTAAKTPVQPQENTSEEKPEQATKQINSKANSKASTLPCTQEGDLKPEPDLLPKIKPKGSCSAFIHFSSELLKKSNAEFGLPEESKHVEKVKVVSQRWKEMTDEQKKPYQQMQEEDKIRFQKETEQFKNEGFFINKAGVKSTDILPELKDFSKETVMPKKIMTPFMYYLQEFDHQKYKEQSGEKFKLGEACKVRAEQYQQITDAERRRLVEQTERDRQRYEREVHQLRTLGYFIDKNGVKSTDLKKKKGKTERDAEKKEKIKEKEQQAQSEEKETIGWSAYYQKNFEKTWHIADGKTEKTKKANVDKILQQQWLEMSDLAKKKIINQAVRAKNGEVTLGKRKKPDNESSPIGDTASVKQQKN